MNSNQRLSYLDGLKGFGCIMVFLTHFKMFGFSHPFEFFSFVNEIFYGDMFVNIFIFASAFGISASIHANMSKENGLRQVILKRYFRLALPIGIALLFSAFIHYCGLQWNEEAAAIGGNKLLTNYYNHVSFLGLIKALLLSPFGNVFGWMSQAWMLKYIFYGTFMTIALVLGTEGISPCKKFLIGTFFCLIFYLIDDRNVFVVLGFMLYEYLRNKNNRKYDLAIATLFFSLFFCLRGVTYYLHWHRHGNISLFLALFLIIAIIHSAKIQKLLSTKVMLWLGKISMPIYLFHFILLVSFSSWIYVVGQNLPPFILCLVNLSTTSAILFVLSWINQKYVETHISMPIIKAVIRFVEK